MPQKSESQSSSRSSVEPKKESEKLQKVLARAGFGSRREIEGWIEAGRVKVNDVAATLGDRVTFHDKVRVNGRVVHPQRLFGQRRRVLVYYKDVGTVCTRSDPEKRRTIYRDLPSIKTGRWISVGRLDINTSGLMIMTTDGELANRLIHPSYEIEREYLVRVLGKVAPAVLDRLTQGIELEDGPAKFDKLIDMGGEGANHWYRVTLHEGRNREVRRIWESQGVQVSRLSRISFGPVEIPRRLPRGKWQELEQTEIETLCGVVGLHEKPSSNKKTSFNKKTSSDKRVVSGKKASSRKKVSSKKKASPNKKIPSDKRVVSSKKASSSEKVSSRKKVVKKKAVKKKAT